MILVGPRWWQESPTAAAIRTQGRVLYALFLRESETRRGRAFALSYMAAGLEPLAVIGAISLLFVMLDRQAAYGPSLLVFIGTGVFPVYIFLHTSMRVRQPLAVEPIGRLPVESSIDHLLVHGVLHLMVTAVVAVGFFVFLYYAFHDRSAIPFDLWAAIQALSALFTLGIAMGIFNSVIARAVPLWDTVWPGFARAGIHFSGMYFIADYLPPDHRKWFALNPLLHGVSWFRTAFFPTYPRIIDNHQYILWAALIAITLGLLLERQVHSATSGDS